ncbi:MAG TPA: EamA family transporter [Steroidobacteraceae bacterium]|nr:EamA family transporter [Steroidobacteraceae bacterium]
MNARRSTRADSGLHAGVAAALVSALLFGATTPIAKQLLQGATPLLIAGLLYLGSGIGLGLLRLIQDRRWRPIGLRGAQWSWLAAATLTGGVLAPALLMLGLTRSDAATASLLLNLEAVFSAVLAWLIFREATSRRVVLGFVSIFVGGLLLAWPAHLSQSGRALGLLGVAAACLCWGLDNNFTRKVSAADSRVIAGTKGLVAGSTNTILAIALGATLPTRPYLLGSLLLGFLGYGVSLMLFIVALRHLGTARTGAYFSTSPFIGTLLAIVLYGQPVTLAFYLAAVLMALGVWLHVTEHHEHEHLHEPLTHTHSHLHDAHHQHEHADEYAGAEPHTHEHHHAPLRHSHAHFPDIHHQHGHHRPPG